MGSERAQRLHFILIYNFVLLIYIFVFNVNAECSRLYIIFSLISAKGFAVLNLSYLLKLQVFDGFLGVYKSVYKRLKTFK